MLGRVWSEQHRFSYCVLLPVQVCFGREWLTTWHHLYMFVLYIFQCPYGYCKRVGKRWKPKNNPKQRCSYRSRDNGFWGFCSWNSGETRCQAKASGEVPQVFIVQPVKQVARERSTSFCWGKCCCQCTCGRREQYRVASQHAPTSLTVVTLTNRILAMLPSSRRCHLHAEYRQPILFLVMLVTTEHLLLSFERKSQKSRQRYRD